MCVCVCGGGGGVESTRSMALPRGTMGWCVQFVIVLFSDHNHLLLEAMKN